MILNMMKAKIHRATVTEANVNYVGSITIDKDLMDAVGILPNEQVQVVDNNNGSRLVTYAIEGEPGSGVICLNGAAALLVNPGDIVIIMAFAGMNEEEAKNHKPNVILVDENNKIVRVLSETAGETV
ncbi:MAG: aspartate 1-decarboxylase [Bacillota bacterium]|jgi:aspartate 1-decarboxylase